MNKAKISNILRRFKLIYLADKLRFHLNQYKNLEKNKQFRKANPTVNFPPDYLIYESFQMDFEKYYSGGKNTAEWLKNQFEKYGASKQVKILDWGCGPARVVRHMPEIFPDAEVYGTDYNAESIEWNKKHIENVRFNLNSMEAELPYENDFFDFIYGISIFTHLSEEKHYEWFQELFRILKPGGILLLTLQGNAFKSILTDEEKNIFDEGKLVVRGNVKEGHRTFSAFHPTQFVNTLFHKMEVLDHQESFSRNGKLEQDVWIFRK